MTPNVDKHIRSLVNADTKFRETFSSYWLGKINAEMAWMRKYVKHLEEEENDKRQLKLKL